VAKQGHCRLIASHEGWLGGFWLLDIEGVEFWKWRVSVDQRGLWLKFWLKIWLGAGVKLILKIRSMSLDTRELSACAVSLCSQGGAFCFELRIPSLQSRHLYLKAGILELYKRKFNTSARGGKYESRGSLVEKKYGISCSSSSSSSWTGAGRAGAGAGVEAFLALVRCFFAGCSSRARSGEAA